MKKTVVPLGNQMERFFPLGNFGKKARNSPRSILRKCDEANGSVIFRLFRQERERGIRLQLFLFFSQKKSSGKETGRTVAPFVVLPKRPFFFRSKGSATSSFKKNEYRKGGAPFFFVTARKQLIGWLVFPAG